MESENDETALKNPEGKKLKTIMFRGITNIIEFSTELSTGDKLDFEDKLSGKYIKIFHASFRVSIIEYLKQQKI